MRHRSSWFVVAAAALVAGPLARAQSGPELPAFRTGTAVVAVPVFVTDRSGKAVAGLTAADFVVEDNGKPVPIVGFQAVDAGEANAVVPVTTAGGSLLRAAARRQFLLLIDLSFSTAAGVRRAQQAAQEFVAKGLGPGDLAALATFGSAGVKVHIAFTSDRQQLAAAIGGFGSPDQPRVRDPLSLAFDLGITGRDLQSAAAAEGLSRIDEEMQAQLIQMEQSERRAYQARVENFVSGLDSLSRLLDSVQGRKQIILLSGGFDQRVLGGVQGAQREESVAAVAQGRLWEVDSEGHFGSSSASRVLDELFRSMAASDTVVHTVDVAGLTAGGDPSDGTRQDRASGRDTLALLAANTGGQFITGTNDVTGALREVTEASRHWYVLAFEPRDDPGKKPRFRKLKVRVRGEGLKASHRVGYVLGVDPADPATASRGQMQAAEVIAKGLSGGQLALSAVAVPYRDRHGRVLLPVVLQLDGRSLLQGVTAKQLALEVYGYLFDAAGRIVDTVVLTPGLDLAQVQESLRAGGLQLLTSFRATPGMHDIRFLVRDRTTGRAGALRTTVEVPAFARELRLSSPLFVSEPTSRLVLPAASRGNPALEIPFRLGDRAFTAEAMPVLRTGSVHEVAVLAWSGPNYDATSPLQLTAELRDAAGDTLPVESTPPKIVADADGFQRFVVELRPAGITPGDYTLRLAFTDPKTGTVTSTERPVRAE